MTLLNQIKTSSKFLNTSYSNRSQHVGLHDCQDRCPLICSSVRFIGGGGFNLPLQEDDLPTRTCLGGSALTLRRVPGTTGQNVGYKKVNCVPTFNADDAVLFAQDSGRWQAELKHFDDTANTMGLHTSWEKTKLQNTGYGPPVQSHGVCCVVEMLEFCLPPA